MTRVRWSGVGEGRWEGVVGAVAVAEVVRQGEKSFSWRLLPAGAGGTRTTVEGAQGTAEVALARQDEDARPGSPQGRRTAASSSGALERRGTHAVAIDEPMLLRFGREGLVLFLVLGGLALLFSLSCGLCCVAGSLPSG